MKGLQNNIHAPSITISIAISSWCFWFPSLDYVTPRYFTLSFALIPGMNWYSSELCFCIHSSISSMFSLIVTVQSLLNFQWSVSCKHFPSSNPPSKISNSSFQLLAAFSRFLFIVTDLLTFQLFAYIILSSTKPTISFFHFTFLFGDCYSSLMFSLEIHWRIDNEFLMIQTLVLIHKVCIFYLRSMLFWLCQGRSWYNTLYF